MDAGRLAAQEREDVKAGLLTREEHYAARGLDYRRELRQAAAEARYIMELSQEFEIPPEMIDAAFTNPRGRDSFGGGIGENANPENGTATESKPAQQDTSKNGTNSFSARCPRGECTHKWAKGGCQKKNAQ